MNTWLLRHTKVAVPDGVCYGQADMLLASTFDEEAAAVAASLPAKEMFIVSSPLIRCRALALRLGATARFDQRLRELNFGQWEMCAWTEIPRTELETWANDFVNLRPPQGESFAELQARACAALRDAKTAAGERPLLLCTHAGVIRALLATARGIPLNEAFSITVDFGSLHALDDVCAAPPSAQR